VFNYAQKCGCWSRWPPVLFPLTPIKCANSDRERLVRSRMARTPAGLTANRREGLLSAAQNCSGFAYADQQFFKQLFFQRRTCSYNSGELRNLFRSQVSRRGLRICVAQQDHVFSHGQFELSPMADSSQMSAGRARLRASAGVSGTGLAVCLSFASERQR